MDAQQVRLEGIDFWKLWVEQEFRAKKLWIDNGNLKIQSKNSDSIKLSISKVNLELKNLETNTHQLKQKLPFSHNGITGTLDSLYADISPYESLLVANISLKEGILKTGMISILPKYSKIEFSNKVRYEREHIALQVLSAKAANMRWNTINDSLKLSSDELVLRKVEAFLHKNKRIADNTENTPLYGTMLKNLPVKLTIKTVRLEGGQISYSERIKEDVAPALISFERLQAEIRNLSNTTTESTAVSATAKLMGKAPISLNFSFQINDANDRFIATSTLKNLDAKIINPFLVSNAKVRAKGRIDELYFTISGNNHESSGDMKMKYRDFKFSVLDDDRLRINKTLSTVVNLLTNDGSKADANCYRYGTIAVERDRTKSFFNYLWLNAKDGLKNTVTGDGKKEE